MQAAILAALEKFLTSSGPALLMKLWAKFSPTLKPMLMAIVYSAASRSLQALKDRTLPDNSPLKFLEGTADELLQEVIDMLPAPDPQLLAATAYGRAAEAAKSVDAVVVASG